jgi:HAD superfamily hydrolase (TIGR01509 family)
MAQPRRPQGTSLEAVFFDLGDTIVDLREGQGDYMARAATRAGQVFDVMAAAGVPLPSRQVFSAALAESLEAFYQAAVSQRLGIDIYDALRHFFGQTNLPAGDGLVIAAGDAYARPGPSLAPLREGARELLTALSAQGLRLGVISNTLQPFWSMDEALERRGLLHLFVTRTYSSQTRVAKPHPDIFRAALGAMGVAPNRALHVGDRLAADVAGAHGVNMKAVLVEVSHRSESDSDIVPDARIRELPELLDVLPGLYGGTKWNRPRTT